MCICILIVRSSALCADQTQCARTCAEMPEAYHHRQLRYLCYTRPLPSRLLLLRTPAMGLSRRSRFGQVRYRERLPPAPRAVQQQGTCLSTSTGPIIIGSCWFSFRCFFLSFSFVVFYYPKNRYEGSERPNNVAPTTRPS